MSFPLFHLAWAGVGVLAILHCDFWKWPRVRGVAKTLTSTAFLMAAIEGGALESTVGLWFFGALLLGFLGDVLLIGTSPRFFLMGLGSFLLGHLVYIGAFTHLDLDWSAVATAGVVLALVGTVVARWLLPKTPSNLRIPILIYMIAISGMVACAWGTLDRVSGGFAFAATAFYLSDLSVSLERFVSDRFIHRLWGVPLYFGAQITTACLLGYGLPQ